MTDHILEAYREDIAIRRRDKHVLGVPEQAEGDKVRAHEITPGTVGPHRLEDGADRQPAQSEPARAVEERTPGRPSIFLAAEQDWPPVVSVRETP